MMKEERDRRRIFRELLLNSKDEWLKALNN